MAFPVDLYLRVSRIGGREHLISPEEQERDARAFAKRRGLQVAEVFTDLDRSGGTLDRPELQKALARVREGKSGGIVVAYLSRLSRETSQGLSLLEEIREAGGDVYAPNLSDHTTADGRMLNTIQLAIDSGMRERAKEQIARARENAIANGIPVANRDAVGYRRHPKTRRYEPDPDVAPAIREVFDRRAAGAGPSELAELLEARGVRTSQGSATWSKPAVQNLLKSRTYLGEIRSGPYVNPNAHEALVDEPTWLAAQRPNPAPRRRRSSGYLLSGILRCAACGYSMQGTTTSRGGRIYRCVRRHAGGICPAPARIDAETADAHARFALVMLAGGTAVTKPQSGAPDLAGLREALEAAQRRLHQAQADDVQEALGHAVWVTMLAERKRAVDDAAAALGLAEAEAARLETLVDVSTVQKDFDRGALEMRRELLARFFDLFAVTRDKEVLVYSRGTAPDDLPRQGRPTTGLHPLPVAGEYFEGFALSPLPAPPPLDHLPHPLSR